MSTIAERAVRLTAADVLKAIHRQHHTAAIVHEVVLTDPEWKAGRGGTPQRRIDALMILGQQRTAIEIKVSRSDYARETDEKRRAWRSICHRFVYVVPTGLITPDEVPDGIGLWEVDPRYPWGVCSVRRARINHNPQPVPDHVFTAMCYRAMRAPEPQNSEDPSDDR